MGKISIAICGGGIGGLALANALAKNDNVVFDLYEAAPQVASGGLGVGLSPNAERALSMIDPKAQRALDEAGAVTMDPTIQIRMGNGPDLGKLVHTFGSEHRTRQVERAPFLDALCKNVAPERLHAGKKMVDITQNEDGSYTISFEDGTHASADAIVGFDGIHSKVRKYILGDSDAAAEPQFSGICSYWAIVPSDHARSILGLKEIPNTQQAWYGKDGYILYNPVSEGKNLMIAGCKPLEQPWTDNPWFQLRTPEEVHQDFADWGEFGKQMAQLFVDPASGKATMLAFWEHPNARTYFRDHVCVAGDAAHSMCPFQGAGAGQAIEDALVLARVLEHAQSPADIRAAFAAYDSVRRPRSQSIVASSKQMGMTALGRDAIKGDYEKLQASLPKAWDHIVLLDTEAHCEEAVQLMRTATAAKAEATLPGGT